MAKQSPAERAAEIAALGPWFHNLHLPDGVETSPGHPLGDFPRFKWEAIAAHIPADLRGWRALDVGCNAGFYSIELARRGAQVTAIDHDPHYLDQARWAAREFGVEAAISFREQQIYEIAREGERFDLVWYMGVAYHLRYPLLALDVLARRTRRLFVFQTLTYPDRARRTARADYGIDDRGELAQPGWPKMAFIEGQFAGDPTNWWVPNLACAEATLRSAGLRSVATPHDETFVCVPDPSVIRVAVDEAEYRAALGLYDDPLAARPS